MTDAIVSARYYDNVVGKEFTVVGIYERSIRGEHGSLQDSEVVVDVQYENTNDLVRIELQKFKNDPEIELIETPAWFERGTKP